MRVIILSVSALFTSLALLISGNAMLTTLVSLRLNIEQVSDSALGLVLALYSVGFVTGASYSIKVIRQVGHIRAYAAFAAVACAIALMHPLIVHAEVWMVMRFALGFCMAGLMTVIESWINDRATNESRGKLLGVYNITFYLASTLGQLLISFNDPRDFVAYTVVAILVVMSLVPLAMTQSLIPIAPAQQSSLGLRQLARQAPSGLTGSLIAGLSIGAFLALGPVFANRAGLDFIAVSKYMGFTVICAVLLQWPAGWLSDKKGRLPVLAAALLLGALSAAAAALFGKQSTTALFLFSGVFFALTTTIYPVSLALTNDNLPNEQIVEAGAAMLKVYGLGSMLGPLLIAVLMGTFGDAALFATISLCMLLAAGLIQFRFRSDDLVPIVEQGEFVANVPASTAVLTEIDPRNEDFSEHQLGEPSDWDIADKLEILLPDGEEVAQILEEQRAQEAAASEK